MNTTATHERVETETVEIFAVWKNGELRRTFADEKLAKHSADSMGAFSSGGDRVVTRHMIEVANDPEAIVYELADGEATLSDRRKNGGDADLTHEEALQKLQERMRPGFKIEAVRRWEGFETRYLRYKTGTVWRAVALFDDGHALVSADRLESKHWWQADHK